MKKEFITLTILSSSLVIFYLLFPDLQENMKKTKQVQDDYMVLKNENVNQEIYKHSNQSLLTFDLVRISKDGDLVMAGKSQPFQSIELLDGQEVIAEIVSDANGEWVWFNDFPLESGIKRFKLQYKENLNNKGKSDQTIIVLIDNKYGSKPKVAKLLNSDLENIDLLNLENISDGITIDILSYSPSGHIIISGRTLPNNNLKFLKSAKVIGTTKSDENGIWKFTLEGNNLSNEKISVTTNINGEEVILSYSQSELKERFENKKFKFVDKKIIVQQGNSLWRIARKALGGGIFYTEIYENNSKKIKNPDLIFPGQVFNIPVKRKKTFYD